MQEQPVVPGSLRNHLISDNIAVLDPDDFALASASRRVDHELLEIVVRYGLDSNDAMVLLESSRAGISGIISFDRDMKRAAVDFDICTRLDKD